MADGGIGVADLITRTWHAGAPIDARILDTRATRIAIGSVVTGVSFDADTALITDASARAVAIIGTPLGTGTAHTYSVVFAIDIIPTAVEGFFAETGIEVAQLITSTCGTGRIT